MNDEEFFSVTTECQVMTFRLSEIVAINTPNRPNKPAGWPDGFEAEVFLRNRPDSLLLTEEQLKQLMARLEAKEPPKTKPQWEHT